MKKILLLSALMLCAIPAMAQTIGQNVVPGFMSPAGSNGCPTTNACFVPYSGTNPLPVTGSGGGSPLDVTTNPVVLTPTNRGGTLTTGNTAQNAMASNASRKAWCIQNDPAETETLYVRTSGTASSTAADAALVPGAQACNTPSTIVTATVSVVASDTGHRWYGWEAQ